MASLSRAATGQLREDPVDIQTLNRHVTAQDRDEDNNQARHVPLDSASDDGFDALEEDDSDQGYNVSTQSLLTDTDSAAFRALDDLFYQRLQQDPLQEHLDRHQGLVNTLAGPQDKTSDQDNFNARLSQVMTENGYDRLRHPLREDYNLKRTYFIDNFFNEYRSEADPAHEIERQWQTKIAQLEGAKGQPLDEENKTYLRACGLRDHISDFAIKGAAKHFFVLKTCGPIGYLMYLTSHVFPDQIRDAAIIDLSHQFNLSRADVQEALLMANAARDLMVDRTKLFQDIYKIAQAFKNRQKVAPATPANNNYLSKAANDNRPFANDNINIFSQSQQQSMAIGQSPIFIQEKKVSTFRFKALNNTESINKTSAQSSINRGVANPIGGLQPGNKAINLQKYEIKTKNFYLKDGTTITGGEALDAAIEFLGKGYKDLGKGRFVSGDGLKQVRMGDADLLGLHGGDRHINFEILKINPKNPMKLLPVQNLHIYLKP